MLKIYLPWKNLGCFGIKLGSWFYIDFYAAPDWGSYMRVGHFKYYASLRRFWRGYRLTRESQWLKDHWAEVVASESITP
jgi:hypothetical protein